MNTDAGAEVHENGATKSPVGAVVCPSDAAANGFSKIWFGEAMAENVGDMCKRLALSSEMEAGGAGGACESELADGGRVEPCEPVWRTSLRAAKKDPLLGLESRFESDPSDEVTADTAGYELLRSESEAIESGSSTGYLIAGRG